MTQNQAFKDGLVFKEDQNQKILELLKNRYFVPTNVIKGISSQYNRSILDLRKNGYPIVSVKRYGLYGFMLY